MRGGDDDEGGVPISRWTREADDGPGLWDTTESAPRAVMLRATPRPPSVA
jgi:hypothetical protein